MKILMICNTDGALYVFRQPIIEAALARGHSVHTVSGESDYFERLRELGVKPTALDFSRHSAGLLDNLRLLIALWRHVRKVKPDVVHSFTHKAAIYGTLAARWAGVAPVFVTITGLGTLFIRQGVKVSVLRWALLLQYRIALRHARRVYFQNPDNLQYFVDRGIVGRDRAVLTAGSGIDLAKYPFPSSAQVFKDRASVEAELGQSLQGRMLVLFPARGVREKGFFEFYEASRQLHEACPGRFVFMHLGLIDEASSGFISKAGILEFARESGVHYLGFKDDIERYMRASDIVCLPSYSEGTPRSLIEAIAFGKVVVATDAPGCRETVIDGKTGYLCKVADADSLRHAIEQVTPEFLEQAASASRSLCESKFDATRIVDVTLGDYEAGQAQ